MKWWPWTKPPEPKRFPPRALMFCVLCFNIWFTEKDNQATYAHPGIFGRTDKLSLNHIKEYLWICYGVKESDVPYQDLVSCN